MEVVVVGVGHRKRTIFLEVAGMVSTVHCRGDQTLFETGLHMLHGEAASQKRSKVAKKVLEKLASVVLKGYVAWNPEIKLYTHYFLVTKGT